MKYWKSLCQTGFPPGYQAGWQKLGGGTLTQSTSLSLNLYQWAFPKTRQRQRGIRWYKSINVEALCVSTLLPFPWALPLYQRKTQKKNSLKALDTLVPSGEYDQDCWNSHEENRDETTCSEDSVPVLLVWGFFVLFWGKEVRGFVRVYLLGLGLGFFFFAWMFFFSNDCFLLHCQEGG